MTRCPLGCGARVADVAAHYAGDSCPVLVAAFGAVTADGKRREKYTHYRLDRMEQAARDVTLRPFQARGRREARPLDKIGRK